MRGTQFFAAASNPHHPCSRLHGATADHRNIHKTPAAHFNQLYGRMPPIPPRRTERSWIHEQFVSEYLSQVPDSTLLGEPPPNIVNSEADLPRDSRVHLARLRCGHHPSLGTYQNRIDPTIDPTCRYCEEAPETMPHLMEDCSQLSDLRAAHDIRLVSHLWSRPRESIQFPRSAGLL